MKSLAVGRRRRRRTSTTAACSIKSNRPTADFAMRTTVQNPPNVSNERRSTERRGVPRLLHALDQLAGQSPRIISKSVGQFESAGRSYALPRYVYLGPKGGGDVIRIAIFATIHGDEPEGALALARFVSELERNPDIAQGYALYIYPVCNPTGFEDNTRHARSGRDLNREFWVQSAQPEVRYLESEICLH